MDVLPRLPQSLLRQVYVCVASCMFSLSWAAATSFAESPREKLTDAIIKADLDAIDAAFRLGVRIEDKNEIKETPLAEAVSFGDLNIVKHLIAKGANVNAKVYDEQTPIFMVAAGSGNLAVVELLIKNRANHQVTDKLGQNALEEAAMSGDKAIYNRLRKLGMKSNYPLHIAAGLGDVENMKSLIEAGAKINQQTKGWKYTPVFFAATSGQPEAIKELLSKKADPNLTSALTESPLHFAASGVDLDVVKALVEGGAKVNTKTNSGETPFDWSYEDPIIEYLKSKGAKSGIK